MIRRTAGKFAILLLLLLPTLCLAAEYYVAPNGSASGNGSRQQPLDLATVLKGGGVQPGSAIWLMGGTYHGAYTSYLRGTSSAPITVRVVPGERAVLDGQGFRGERQNAVLAIFGEWTNYIGLEITGSARNREHPEGNEFRQAGLDIFGKHVKVINFVIHDTGEGNGMWSDATDAELYGSIIFNCGSRNTPRDNRHGHGMYTQNYAGTMQIRDNLIFNDFGFGIHGWGKPKGITGYEFEGNIIFNSGAPSGDGMRLANILLTGGSKVISDRISLVNNYLFQTPEYKPVSDVLHDTGLCLVCDNTSLHGSASLRDNYFGGGAPAAIIGRWRNISFTGNTIVSSNGMVVTKDLQGSSNWDRNRYFGSGYTGKEQALFIYNDQPRNFAEWQRATGKDRDSTYSPSFPQNAVFVRRNEYEQGRGHIAVYNWERARSVSVDISSVVSAGSEFEIRNAQDWFGAPVVSGRYRGGRVEIPMSGLRIERPAGLGFATPSTLPEFNAFVILPAGKYAVEETSAEVAPSKPSRSWRDERPARPDVDLRQFAGRYVSLLPPGAIDIMVSENGLRAIMATERNRPSYPLEFDSGLRFTGDGPPSFYIEFAKQGNRIVGAKMVVSKGPTYTLRKK